MSNTAVFAYPEALSFSGQTAATLLAMRELERLGWTCYPVAFTALDRSAAPLRGYLRYGLGLIGAWVKLATNAARRGRILCFNHGQSPASFIRMGLPHLALRRILPRRRIVTSLHGNLFMTWDADSRRMRFFLRLLMASDAITVLGEAQRTRLAELGVPDDRLVVVPNTADTPLVPMATLRAKHAAATTAKTPLVLLHLSLLIESKGYVEFLEACLLLARNGLEHPVEVVLCGPLGFTPFCTRFTTPESKRAWIEDRIAALNACANVTAIWHQGAQGAEKAALFEKAHCFVLPTRFPVEAQPLVLLEAMAAGCALIASDQGEIPSTMGTDTGFCLNDTSHPALARAIGRMLADPAGRADMALAARRRAEEEFGAARYGQNWFDLLTRLKPEAE